MTAYDPAQWTDLFVATAGASAALAGLLFVAVSINLDRILGDAGLPDRALEEQRRPRHRAAFPQPHDYPRHLPAADPRTGQLRPPRAWVLARWGLRVAGTLPFVIGGASVLLETGGGLYWIAAGIVFAIVGAVANAWVLLVEIPR